MNRMVMTTLLEKKGWKVLSSEILKGMKKEELVERVEMLENNWACTVGKFENLSNALSNIASDNIEEKIGKSLTRYCKFTYKYLTGIRTCESYPEQYSVYNHDGREVMYIRLRNGHLSAYTPDVNGKIFFSDVFEDDLKGSFDNDWERVKYLSLIIAAYYEYRKNSNNKE